jgi:fatty acid desaturase
MQDFVGAKGIISAERLRVLSERSDGPGLLHLASHLGALVASSYCLLSSAGTWWCIAPFIIQGILLNFLYAPEHECDHFTAFRSRWLNVWVGRVCGFLTFFPNDYHRWSHYAHHRNTQDWDKDTELLARARVDSPARYLLALTGIANIVGRCTSLWRHALRGANLWYATPRQNRAVTSSARWHLALYLLIAMHAWWIGSWWPVYLWLGPWAALRWHYWVQGLVEHGGLTHAPNTLFNTRTFSTNWCMHLLNWNMTYHSAHHTFPAVPFHRLPALHAEIEQQLGHALPTSTCWQAHWRHLRLLHAGADEAQMCAAHDQELREQGLDTLAHASADPERHSALSV